MATEPLGPTHDRGAFSCGSQELDLYLRERARQDQERTDRYVGSCRHAQTSGKSLVTTRWRPTPSVPAICRPKSPRKLPRYPHNSRGDPWQAGRIRENTSAKGLGEFLLLDAMQRSLDQSKALGLFALFVDAKDEQAANFYRHYDFIPLPSQPLRLFLPMKTIADLFA